MENEFDAKARKAMPAEIHMISACRDSQTASDISNVDAFKLPDPKGLAGGVCTSALLKVLYDDHHTPSKKLSWAEILTLMRLELKKKGFHQVPQLTSSRLMNVDEPFRIVNSSPNTSLSGARRALLIGINYTGQKGELSGCHNDVERIKEYIMNVHGFRERDITILIDDGKGPSPTRHNIMLQLKQLVKESVAGDSVFFHYSGHGGRLADDNGDEYDGYDETLIPVDFEKAGQIRDDELYRYFVTKFKEGVLVTSLMDCCHSGTVLDLPYKFVADGIQDRMQADKTLNLDDILIFAVAAASAVAAVSCCDCLMTGADFL